MPFTRIWAIARPDYAPHLDAAGAARAAAFAAAWRALRRAVRRLVRPSRRGRGGRLTPTTCG